MSSSTSWNDIVTKIKGVTFGNRSVSQSSTVASWDANTGGFTFLTYVTVDATGVYNSGWNNGVVAADNRANPGCANWNAGRSQGQADVTNNPNGYGLYTKSQYDANWSGGYNSGYSAGYNAANNVQWTSGQVGSSGPFNTSWSTGKTQSTYYLNIGLGWQPALIACYCTTNSSHWVIRYHDTCVAAGNGCGTCNNLGNFSWNSSNAQIPTMRTSNTTWAYYACGYN